MREGSFFVIFSLYFSIDIRWDKSSTVKAGKKPERIKKMSKTKVKWINSETSKAKQAMLSTGSGTASWQDISSIRETITQASHGFAAKDVIRHNGTNWVKAQADSTTNVESLGIVESVDGNDFVVVYSGKLTTTGLTANTLYFLSSGTAGLLTDTAPTLSKPVLFAISTTVGYVLSYRYIDTSDAGITRSIEASTATSGSPNQLTAGESNKIITNEGATEKSYQILPSASSGLTFTFMIQDADGMRVTASSGDTIRLEAYESTTAGYIESTQIGSSVELVAINATEWMAINLLGSWDIATS